MSVTAVKTGLKERVETIIDFQGKVFTYIPGEQNPPSVTIIPGTFVPGDTKAALTYDNHFLGEDHAYIFTLAVVVSRVVDSQSALDLDTYISPVGPKSIRTAILTDDTLGGTAHWTKVVKVIQYGSLTWNSLSYFGAQIIVEVNAA